MDFKEELRLIESKEAKLNELKKTPKENASEIYQLLLDIRSSYKACILFDVTSSVSPQDKVLSKELDGSLWRSCFYKQIEEYRKSIKNTTLVIDNGTNDNNNLQLIDKARGHLAKLTSALIRMLSESIQFYMELLKELENSYIRKSTSRISTSIFKCLLYLGDLSRYYTAHGGREGGNSNPDKCDFSTAQNYYDRAYRVLPASGNPHNQLAMLATQTKQEFVACYYYCRSTLCQQPFNNGLVNLSSVFEANKKLFITIHGNESIPSILLDANTNAKAGPSVSKAEASKAVDIKMKSFFVGFIRLQGIVFEVNKSISLANDISEIQPLNISQYDTLRDHLFSEFEELLLFSQFGDGFFCQMLSILLFTVQFSSNTHKAFSEKNYGQISESKSMTQLSSLITLYGFLKKIVAITVRIVNSKDNKEKYKRSLFSKYLTFPSLFSEWYVNTNNYNYNNGDKSKNESRSSSIASPRQRPVATSMEINSDVSFSAAASFPPSLCGDPLLVSSERKTFVSVRSSLSLLLDIPNLRSGQPISPKYQLVPMREHMELRGYAPFMPHIEKYFAGFDNITNSVVLPSEEDCISRKFQNIQEFLLTPSPKSDDEEAKITKIGSQTELSKKLLQSSSNNNSKAKISFKVKHSSNSNFKDNTNSPPVLVMSKSNSYSDAMVQSSYEDPTPVDSVFTGLSSLNSMDLPASETAEANLPASDGPNGSKTNQIQETFDGSNRVEDLWNSLTKSGVQSTINTTASSELTTIQPDEDDEVDEEMFEYRPVTSRFVFSSAEASSEVDVDRTGKSMFGRTVSQDELLGGISSHNVLRDPFSNSGNNFEQLNSVAGSNLEPLPSSFFFDSLINSSDSIQFGRNNGETFYPPFSSLSAHTAANMMPTHPHQQQQQLSSHLYGAVENSVAAPPPGLPPPGLGGSASNKNKIGNGYFVESFKTENPFFSEY
jgi:hypothetical protein